MHFGWDWRLLRVWISISLRFIVTLQRLQSSFLIVLLVVKGIAQERWQECIGNGKETTCRARSE